jgi:glycosyltransferase involved in cell wall biosynthesis
MGNFKKDYKIKMPVLSVIIPVYNEINTIKQIIDKISGLNIDKEIIAVDDGSTDGTDRVLSGLSYSNLKIIHHARNRGKGAAVLTGLSHASGEFVIIQDADLEYDPNDYFKLLEAIKINNADIALGARFTREYKGLLFHRLGNKFLTGVLNFMFHVKLNDCFTCYKLMRREAVTMLNLKAQGFDIEIEILAKAIKKKLRIVETHVSYSPRSYSEGKKIRCRDGLHAALSIIKYRFS